MVIPNDKDEEEYDMFMVVVATYAKISSERFSYAPKEFQ
jgi:hypothetical protein